MRNMMTRKYGTSRLPETHRRDERCSKPGLVDSLNQPAGNMTGVYQFTAGLEAKRLGLLHEMVPKATTIAVLINSNYSGAEGELRAVQEAAPRLGVQLLIVRANAESEFNTAFSTSSNRGSGRYWSAPRHSSTPAGVHHAARRRGGRVAARGKGASLAEASARCLAERWRAGRLFGLRRCLSARDAGSGLHRRARRRYRLPLR